MQIPRVHLHKLALHRLHNMIGGSAGLKLLVATKTGASTVKLPTSGDVVIGRAADCHVRVDDPTVAEQHALLRIGPPMTLIDLGVGATSVGNRPIEPGAARPLAVGMVVLLGAATLMVQASVASTRLRPVRTHDYFEARLEDECVRAASSGGTFGVLRLRCPPGSTALVEEAFAKALRPMDVVANYAPDEHEVLLVDAAPALAESITERLGEALPNVRLVLACYPRDARTPEAILEHCTTAIHGHHGAAEPVEAPAQGAMERLHPLVERVAATSMNVLILGETGVGKEVMAHALHRLSPRATKPLLCINCAGLGESLLESELFGFERGAFTGAVYAKAGLLETADGGTVLLDEIGELALPLQAKLLRVIETKQLTRIGALAPRRVDVRFLGATNRDLEAEVEASRFRRDLFFRLNGMTLTIPPLRDRVDEIEPLARSFLAQASEQAGRPPPRISFDALRVLRGYAWPGNVRELRNVMERALLLCTGGLVERAHLPVEKMGRTLPAFAPTPAAPARAPAGDDAPVELGDERARIVGALERCGGNQTQAARLLGISRRTLISRIEGYGLPRPRRRD